MNEWTVDAPATRLEAHFGDRVVRCFADRPANLLAMFQTAVAGNPDGVALVFEGERLTWQAVLQRTDRLAAVLAGKGIRQGDRVALLLGNGLSFPLLLLAIARLGAITVPISHRSRRTEIAHILNQCAAVALVHEPEFEHELPPACDVPACRRYIGSTDLQASDDAMDTSDAPPMPEVAEEDIALLVYTSGTTGQPKGAMITHLNLVHAAMTYAHCMELTARERTLVCVPLSHVTGITGALCAALYCASTLIIMREFKAADFLDLAARERMTHTVMVPAMYKLCLMQPAFAEHDLSDWRIGGYGGAPMPPATIEALQARMPMLKLMNCYGATETSMAIAIMPAAETAQYPDRVGRVVPCAEVVILDEHGQEVPVGSSGEVWIKGPSVARGYWADPAATAEDLTAGFWHSGDIGSFSATGHLGIHDRIKDTINRGGYKIFTSEVENILCTHPAVVECAVVARPCPVLGERVHAFVCIRSEVSASALRSLCEAQLSSHKVPETWTLQSELLPRNTNGKLLKRTLRERAVAELLPPVYSRS